MGLQFFPEPDPEESGARTAARTFVDTAIRPFAIEDDEKCHFRRDVFNELARQGLTTLIIPRQYGGRELSNRSHFGCLEEIARASMAMAITVGVTNMVQGALVSYGTDYQKETFLKRLVAGEWLGAFSLSEPASGSDAASLRTSARKVDGGYRITGNKMWCSSAGDADLYLLMARTSEPRTKGVSAFLVPKTTPGFRVGKQEKKLGLRGSALAELIFEDAFLPESHRIGAEGQGLLIALSQLDSGRIAIGAVGAGAATEAIDRVWRYHAEREAKGIAFPENVKYGLAGHFASLQAVKSLLTSAATLKDSGGKLTTIAAQAKLLGSELAMRVTSDAVEWMGEDGYLKSFEVERLMRDSKALQIVEGTNQIQHLVLAREMEATNA